MPRCPLCGDEMEGSDNEDTVIVDSPYHFSKYMTM